MCAANDILYCDVLYLLSRRLLIRTEAGERLRENRHVLLWWYSSKCCHGCERRLGKKRPYYPLAPLTMLHARCLRRDFRGMCHRPVSPHRPLQPAPRLHPVDC